MDPRGSGATAGALQLDGKLLAFGMVRTGGNSDWSNDIVITRYLRNSIASIAGRVLTPDGRGLRNAVVTITDASGAARRVTTSSFGQYSFTGVPAGDALTLTVSSKRYRFATRIVNLTDDLTGIDPVGTE